MGMCGACCQPRRYQLIGTFTYGVCVYVCVCVYTCVCVCVWVWVLVWVAQIRPCVLRWDRFGNAELALRSFFTHISACPPGRARAGKQPTPAPALLPAGAHTPAPQPPRPMQSMKDPPKPLAVPQLAVTPRSDGMPTDGSVVATPPVPNPVHVQAPDVVGLSAMAAAAVAVAHNPVPVHASAIAGRPVIASAAAAAAAAAASAASAADIAPAPMVGVSRSGDGGVQGATRQAARHGTALPTPGEAQSPPETTVGDGALQHPLSQAAGLTRATPSQSTTSGSPPSGGGAGNGSTSAAGRAAAVASAAAASACDNPGPPVRVPVTPAQRLVPTVPTPASVARGLATSQERRRRLRVVGLARRCATTADVAPSPSAAVATQAAAAVGRTPTASTPSIYSRAPRTAVRAAAAASASPVEVARARLNGVSPGWVDVPPRDGVVAESAFVCRGCGALLGPPRQPKAAQAVGAGPAAESLMSMAVPACDATKPAEERVSMWVRRTHVAATPASVPVTCVGGKLAPAMNSHAVAQGGGTHTAWPVRVDRSRGSDRTAGASGAPTAAAEDDDGGVARQLPCSVWCPLDALAVALYACRRCSAGAVDGSPPLRRSPQSSTRMASCVAMRVLAAADTDMVGCVAFVPGTTARLVRPLPTTA